MTVRLNVNPGPSVVKCTNCQGAGGTLVKREKGVYVHQDSKACRFVEKVRASQERDKQARLKGIRNVPPV